MTEYLSLAWSPEVLPRAPKVGLLVGTILALINHADALVNGTFAVKNLLQVILSYLVPYCVSTYSSVAALRQQRSSPD